MAEQDKDIQESLKRIMVRTDVGKETVVKIENEWNDYTTAYAGLVKLVNEGKMDEARDYRDKETLTRLDTVTATIEEYQKFIIELAETAKKNSDTQACQCIYRHDPHLAHRCSHPYRICCNPHQEYYRSIKPGC